ncbi:MAG: exopolysaccharide transport family protein [Minisyncoccota bacterium]
METYKEIEDSISIKDILALVRRRVWLLAAGLILGALGGFLVSIFQTPIYSASTRILVLRSSQAEKNTDNYLGDQQLAQTYIQLLVSRPVIDGVSGLLGFEVEETQISVKPIPNVQAIQLTVEDESPERAANIANTLVQVLIYQNEQIQAGRYTLTEQKIQAQITQIEDQISQLSSELENISTETVQQQLIEVETQITNMQADETQLQNEIRQLTPPSTNEQQVLLSEKEARLIQIQSVLSLTQKIYADLVVLGKPSASQDGATKLSQLQNTIKLYQEIYINLIDDLESIRLARLQNMPNVVPIETAIPPDEPVRPKPILYTVLAAAVGLMFAGAVAFLIENLDDTIRSPEDIEQIFKLPILGYIGHFTSNKGESAGIHVLQNPHSPVSEAFRSLRTNLEYMSIDRSMNKILIVSSEPGEGKSTIASNLATIIAQGGKQVLLIDADMRRPRIHSIFGISNRVGLSTLFRGNMTVHSVMRAVAGVDNLLVITSGRQPPNPTELLASAKMDQILREADHEVDLVIIDCPPSLVADFQVLSTKVNRVLIVIQPGVTHAKIAAAMFEQLVRVNANVLGIVLNMIPHNSSYFQGYHSYDDYSKRGGYYYSGKE